VLLQESSYHQPLAEAVAAVAVGQVIAAANYAIHAAIEEL